MKKKFISLFSGVMLGIISVFAAPAVPYPIEMTQPDGSTIMIKMVGDEFGHYLTTEDGIPVKKGADGFFRYIELSSTGEPFAGNWIARDVDERTTAENAYLAALPKHQITETYETQQDIRRQKANTNRVARKSATTGDVKRLVLLVQFSDVKFHYSQSDFNNMLNQTGYNYNGTQGSARDYFMDQSDGQFRPTFDVYGPFTLNKTRAYYGADASNGAHDSRRNELCYDVCDVANSSVDFSKYANGSDVDMIYIFYAGYNQSESGNSDDIWAHQTDLGTSIFDRYDGKNILSYACSSELQGGSGTTRSGIGVFVHEYSHTLGLPDFYDTNRGSGWGMGYWSVMSYGNHSNNGHTPVNFTAYERAYCGWMGITELPAVPASVALENLADSKKAYKISSSDPNQYFILENRQKTGWDSHLSSSGLMITKVDYNASVWNSNDVNTNVSRQRMTLVPADNSTNTERGDLYPYNGNNSFTPTSVPASITNTGIVVNRPITGITQNNGIITFDVMGGVAPDAPVAQTATDITQVKFTANWSLVAGATNYDLIIEHYKNDGTKDNTQTITNLTSTSYSVTGLNNEHYYVYHVIAINGNNDKRSETSNSVRVEMSDEPALPTPTNVTIYDVSEMSFRVSWNKINDASGYRIRVTRRHINGVSDPDWEDIRELPYQASAMIVNKLDKGYIYYCQIQAYNWNGVSRYSDVVTAKIKGDLYAVNFGSAENGTFRILNGSEIIVSGTEIEQGTTLTVETTPNVGYQLDAITVNGEVISGNTFDVRAASEVVVSFAEMQYCTTDVTTSYSNGSRGLNSITMAGGTESFTLSVNQATSGTRAVYFDKTENVFKAETGATIQPTINWTGSWMHGYMFIDYDKNKVFESTINSNGTPAAGSNVVSYTFYSTLTGDAAANGYDSKGVARTNGNAFGDGMPSFVIPADLASGNYRVRFKVDWNSLDPCGSTVSTNKIEANGGCIVDFTMEVSNPTTGLEKAELTNAAKIFYANEQIHTTLEGAIVVYDLTGKPVKQATAAPVLVSNLAKGVYIVRVAGETLKFVK